MRSRVTELLADFLQRMVGVHADAEAHAQHALLARGGREASTRVVVSRRFDWIAPASIEQDGFPLSSMINRHEMRILLVADRTSSSESGSLAILKDLARDHDARARLELTPREERVLSMRFGIGMNTDHTLEEVSQRSRSPASASARSRPRR